ncbi:hypothetical protein B0H10DRAFT_1936710 [Mycena sp. CBHHK59/15]|nr:hypothetical protein B0H10DRAFT_1936710 [Mycena sp. CBHHK59/15]
MPVSLVRETNVDVLIVGAGPAGLMCANALAKAGVNSYGLADRLLKEGNQMHVAVKLTDRVADVTAPTARYPFELTLHQGAIEQIFLDSMTPMGVEVSRPVIPTQIELDPAALGTLTLTWPE